MKNKFFSSLLCVAVLISAMGLHSCKTDLGGLTSRIDNLEKNYKTLQEKLAKVQTSGKTVADYTMDEVDGHIITLSDGDKIVIPHPPKDGGTGGGGGTKVTVDKDSKPGILIITVGETKYEIPMGAAVNSLVYVAESATQPVLLSNWDKDSKTGGATVKLDATPAIEAAALATAVFSIEVPTGDAFATRAGRAEMFEFKEAKIGENNLILLTFAGIHGIEADKTYNTVVKITFRGTTISTLPFLVKVANDYVYKKSEDINPAITLKSDYTPVDVATDAGAKQITVPGREVLGDDINFKNFFDDGVVPAGATFKISAEQANAKAKEKYTMLANSLQADGAWAFSERPGTTFDEGATKGFRFDIIVDEIIVAKTYVVIVDELADPSVDFTCGFSGRINIKYGRKVTGLEPGPWTFAFQPTFLQFNDPAQNTDKWEADNDAGKVFFEKWKTLEIKVGDEILIHQKDGTLTETDLAKRYAYRSEGLYWYIRGLQIKFPKIDDIDPGTLENPQGLKQLDNWEPTPKNGKVYGPSGVAGVTQDQLVEGWGDSPEKLSGRYNMDRWVKYGLVMKKEGVLDVTAAYTGFAYTIRFGVQYEYAFGTRRLAYWKGSENDDVLGEMTFNKNWYSKTGLDQGKVKVPEITDGDLK